MTIVFAIEHYKVYLYGKEFVVRTDHRPLRTMVEWSQKSFDKASSMVDNSGTICIPNWVHQWDAERSSWRTVEVFSIRREEVEDVEEPGIVLNNIQIGKHAAKTTCDENHETLRKWIVKGSKPARLENGVSIKLKSYYSNFDKFKLVLGHVYGESRQELARANFSTLFRLGREEGSRVTLWFTHGWTFDTG